jgi:ABC-type multidrug transport system ATPase subunit
MLRPPILVLDEPTSNLDISAIRELREIVAQWKTSGKTVLIAEHRLWWLRGLADRVVVFQEGSIVEDVPADEFWRRTPDELHAEGLRGSCRFAPQVKEHCADAQYIISPFRSSDGEFTLNIPELKIPKGAVVASSATAAQEKALSQGACADLSASVRYRSSTVKTLCRAKTEQSCLHGISGRQPPAFLRERAGGCDAGAAPIRG